MHLPDGSTKAVRPLEYPPPTPAPPPAGSTAAPEPPGPSSSPASAPPSAPAAPTALAGPTENIPLGRLCGARSGDKGGAANVGLWAVSPRAYDWLRGYLTTDRLRDLLTEAADLTIDRYELPNLLAVNFVIHGLLAPGVSGTTRPDAQAKGLGEYLRSRLVPVPAALL